jgi:hypothetical protein
VWKASDVKLRALSQRLVTESSSERSLLFEVRSLFSEGRERGTVTRKTPSTVAKMVGAAVADAKENRGRELHLTNKLLIFQLFPPRRKTQFTRQR